MRKAAIAPLFGVIAFLSLWYNQEQKPRDANRRDTNRVTQTAETQTAFPPANRRRTAPMDSRSAAI